MKRHYITCPDCHTRMARTGNKEKEYPDAEGYWLYKREYECKNCGTLMIFWESRDLLFPGSLTKK